MSEIFAKIEPAFIFYDERFTTLTATEKWVYIALWCKCVEQCKDATFLQQNCCNLARYTSIDARTARKIVAKLHEKKLISWVDGNHVTVHGVASKHKKLNKMERAKLQKKTQEIEIEIYRDICNEEKIEEVRDGIQGVLYEWTGERHDTDYECQRWLLQAVKNIKSEKLAPDTLSAINFLKLKVVGYMSQCKASARTMHKGVKSWVRDKGYRDDYAALLAPQSRFVDDDVQRRKEKAEALRRERGAANG